MASFNIKVDVGEVKQLALDLADANEVITAAAARGVNAAASDVRKHSVQRVINQVRLQKSYVDERVEITRSAQPSRPIASIEVKDQPVFLFQYAMSQRTQSNVWTAASYAAKFGSLDALVRPKPGAPKMPWTPRRGDPLRAIPAGSKAAGVSGGVKTQQTLRHVFTMPILSGKSFAGRWGSFERDKTTGKIGGLYGPSVYQVMRGTWAEDTGTILDYLNKSVLDEVSNDVLMRLKAT